MTQITAALGLTQAQVEQVIEAAGRAPSLHNTQPWRFCLRPDAVELRADGARRLPATDPDGLAVRLACGAALFNLRLALHGMGVRPLVTPYPHRDRPDLVAVVRHGGTRPATPEQRALLTAIPLRRTNRRPFSEVAIAPPERHALCRAALDEGCWLHIVDDHEQRTRLRDLAIRAHRAQLADPAIHSELERWTAVSADRVDGVPATAGGPLPEPHETWTLRDFARGHAPARLPGKEFEEEPLLAVLSAHLHGPHADLQAGQAMQRVLLTATTRGLSASFLSEIIEVPHTRENLRRLIHGTRAPHVVLRIGYGHPLPPTPRRPVADLLDPRPCPTS
jgi:nitroreductase